MLQSPPARLCARPHRTGSRITSCADNELLTLHAGSRERCIDGREASNQAQLLIMMMGHSFQPSGSAAHDRWPPLPLLPQVDQHAAMQGKGEGGSKMPSPCSRRTNAVATLLTCLSKCGAGSEGCAPHFIVQHRVYDLAHGSLQARPTFATASA